MVRSRKKLAGEQSAKKLLALDCLRLVTFGISCSHKGSVTPIKEQIERYSSALRLAESTSVASKTDDERQCALKYSYSEFVLVEDLLLTVTLRSRSSPDPSEPFTSKSGSPVGLVTCWSPPSLIGTMISQVTAGFAAWQTPFLDSIVATARKWFAVPVGNFSKICSYRENLDLVAFANDWVGDTEVGCRHVCSSILKKRKN